MELNQIAAARAHELLAELIALGAIPGNNPVTCAAKCEERKIQVVVTIATYEPMTIEGENGIPAHGLK